MKSLDELTEMHKSIWLDCYNYATGKLNGVAVRDTLRCIVIYNLQSRLPVDEYDFMVICDETNNPPEMRAKGGYHVDVKITEKQWPNRTFNMPIDATPTIFMSLVESQPNHNSAESESTEIPDNDNQDRR